MLATKHLYFTIPLLGFCLGLVPRAGAAVEQLAQATIDGVPSGQALPALPPGLLSQLRSQLQPGEPVEGIQNAATPETREADRRGREAAGGEAAASQVGPLALESDFSARAGAPLTLFGRLAFSGSSGSVPATGAVHDSYTMGFGDEVEIALRGQSSQNLRGRVGRDGNVVVTGLPPIAAAGRSFAEFRIAVGDAVKRTLGNLDVFVSLGELHQISVLMTGAVVHPGPRRLDAFATVIQAISGELGPQAGLRNIVVTHEGKTHHLDLYDLLTTGMIDDGLELSDGDQIFVPLLQSVIAISGPVNRPAIYEVPAGGITAGELIRLAGGFIRPTGNSLIRLSLDAPGRDQAIDISRAPGTRLRPSDILLVQRSENAQIGTVTVEGDIRLPGLRSLSSTRTVADLIAADQLSVDPYLPFVVVQTLDPISLARGFVAVNLADPERRRTAPALKTGDAVIVLSRSDIRFLGSADVQAVLTGRSPPGLTTTAVVQTPATSVLSDENRSPSTAAARAVGSAQSGGTAPASITRSPACPALQALAAVARIDRSGRFSNAVLGTTVSGNAVIENVLPCPIVFAHYPELLSFMLEHAITVDGEVREPGVYPVADGTTLADIVRLAGGVTRAADLKTIEVSHFSVDQVRSQADTRRDSLALTPADFNRVSLAAGDAVRFNAVFNDRDDGPVLLSGEFRRPGLYDIKRGDHLSSLYARAGGLTDGAYAYGAVMTRARVKATEEAGRERTIRDLQISLSSATSSQGSDSAQGSEAQLAAQQALVALASTPALGRIVFEGDPAMLELHPELDIVLEPGDQIFMPKRSNTVTIAGDVLNPSTQQFRDGLTTQDYVDRSGGYLSTADTGRVFVILPNGQAESAAVSFWNFSKINVPPGSTIVVPRELSDDTLALIKDLTATLSSVALTGASLAVIQR